MFYIFDVHYNFFKYHFRGVASGLLNCVYHESSIYTNGSDLNSVFKLSFQFNPCQSCSVLSSCFPD